MKIYTCTGDDGTTGLFSGERVPKTHPRVVAYGAVDEVNSLLGLARTSAAQPEVDELLRLVQMQLFKLGADLATIGDARKIERIGEKETRWLEAEMDRMMAQVPPLKNFVLPGGTPAAAHIHMARAVSRRAERDAMQIEDCRRDALVYMNRLSDFFFTLALYENHLAGVGEIEWRP
ncbi:MAG: cob(I)yrinic acid a,c-diamide adenosyltransferase [Chthoniobacterales bacterium]